MSLVNQVLSDLEKRGANALPGEASIRAVPVRRNRFGMVLLMALVLALVFVAAYLWRGNPQHKTNTPASAVQQAPAKPITAPHAASQPVAAAVREIPETEKAREEGGQDAVAPASRLSFELGSIPLPSSLRDKPAAAAAEQRPGKTPPPAENKMPPAAPATAAVPALAASAGSVDKQLKQVSVQQQADNEFRRASGLMQQGRTNEAIAGYEAALRLDAGHEAARQALAGLLLESRRNADAERALQDGLKHNPKQVGFAMLLARLQVERNELAPALDTLQKALPYAGQQADYQAFIAALLQRQNRHNEAITHYRTAVQLSPNSGVWLMGLGISLHAVQRNEEARDVFGRAIATRTLSAELQAFVQQQMKELQSAGMR